MGLENPVLGLGLTIVSTLLSFAVKSVPQPVAWAGIAVGLGLIAWPYIPVRFHLQTALAIAGFAILVAAGRWAWEVRAAPEKRAPLTRTPLPVASLASLQYVTFNPRVQRSVQKKTSAVQMAVELKNTNPFLIKIRVRLAGAVNGISPTPLGISFDTFVQPDQTLPILYTRINDVPDNADAGPGRAALHGAMTYDITYWAAENPAGPSRRTSKQCVFEITQPFNDKPSKKGVKFAEVPYKIEVTCHNEIEE